MGSGKERELRSLLLTPPCPRVTRPFFGAQQPMVWDIQLLSPVYPAPAGHPSPAQDLTGYFLSLACFLPLLDAGKAKTREKKRGHTDK